MTNNYGINGNEGLYYNEKGKLEAPQSKVPTAFGAYTIYDQLRKSHVKRALTYSRIQGLIDGNPPYSKEMLRQKGLETQSNVNWRDAESFYESVCLTYWSLFNEVKNIISVNTTFGPPEANALYSDIVSEELDTTIRAWEDFNSVMNEHQADFVKFGVNTLYWIDEKDWRWDSGDVFRVLFPEKTRNNLRNIPYCAIEHPMTAQELFYIYESKSADKYWNKDELARLLTFKATASNEDYLYSNQYIRELQQKIRNNDLTLDELYNEDIMLVSLFIREWNNTITRVIIPIDMAGQVEDFLFRADGQYDDMGHFIHIFTFTPGEKYIHGTKGVGHKSYNVMEGLSQIDNSLMDGVRRSQTVIVRTKAGRGKDLKRIKFTHGGFVDIGEAEVAQNLMGANLSSGVDVANYFRQKLEFNNNISGTSMATRDPKPKTYGEVRAQATKEAKVQKNRIAHYYDQLDKFFREVIRKMLVSKKGYPGYEDVRIWKERCIARGVPPEFFIVTKENEGRYGLPSHLTIRVTRASGSGSQTADQMEMQSIASILPTLGPRGKKAWLADYISAHRGFEYVDRYMPPEDTGDEPTNQDTLASVENNQLEKGELVIVSPDNVHIVHAQRHLNRMKQLAENFNNSANMARQNGSESPFLDAENYGSYSLNELDIAFQTLGPHFVRHLLFLQRDPTAQPVLQQMLPEWNVLSNFADKIAKNAQDHRYAQLREAKKAQEEIDQKIPSEERVAMAKVDSDARIKMAKLNAEITRNANRDLMRFELDRQKIAFSGEVNKAKTISDIANQAAKVQADIKNEEELTKGKRKEEAV